MKYHILSIGISKHQDSSNNLQFAHKDAQEFYVLFTQNVGNIGFHKLLIDNEATLSNIRSALGNELQQQLASDDCFILFYSGHGSVAKTGEDEYGHFLIPFDVTEDIESTGIPVDYIKEVFEKLNCTSKLLIVDSCFSGAVNSKYFGPTLKGILAVKTISNEISGEGRVVFTACKDDEYSLEDPDLKNGVFTSFLLKQLQEDKSKDRISVTDLHTPVVENVGHFTMTKYRFKQSPTFSGDFKSALYLPNFKKPIVVTPDFIEPKVYTELLETFSVPKIELPEKERAAFIEQTIAIVVKAGKISPELSQIEFERFCFKVLNNLKDKYEKKVTETGRTWEEINASLNVLMGESFQLFVLSSVIGIYGSEKQAKVLGEMCAEMFTWSDNKSGSVPILKMPEVLILMVEYLLTITNIAISNFTNLNAFMNCRLYDYRYDAHIPRIIEMDRIVYAESLGGKGSTVADYIKNNLSEMLWLKEIHPRINDLELCHIQANFVLSLLVTSTGSKVWPDFARYHGYRLNHIVRKLHHDTEFQENFARLFNVDTSEIRKKLYEFLKIMESRSLGDRYWWNSISAYNVLTDPEKREMGLIT